MTGSTAASDSNEPNASNRPAAGLRYSGSRTGPSRSSSAIAGRLSRNAEPHQKWSSSKPPTIGPTVTPPVIAPVHTAIAVLRWPASRNMFRISASVEGINVAPARPNTARAPISMPALPAYAAATDAALKATAPSSNSLRRPIRSPSAPMVISRPASTKPYMSMTHSSWVPDGFSSTLMNGIANNSTLTSIDTIRHGSTNTASPIHSFVPALVFKSSSLVPSPRADSHSAGNQLQGGTWRQTTTISTTYC